MSDFSVQCGLCGKDMTRENSKIMPEFFVCDECVPKAKEQIGHDAEAFLKMLSGVIYEEEI